MVKVKNALIPSFQSACERAGVRFLGPDASAEDLASLRQNRAEERHDEQEPTDSQNRQQLEALKKYALEHADVIRNAIKNNAVAQLASKQRQMAAVLNKRLELTEIMSISEKERVFGEDQ